MMNNKSCGHNEKLEQVLKLLLLPDYKIGSTTYFDILLSHIGKSTSNTCSSKTDAIDKTIIQKWVTQALQTWTKEQKPCQPVIIFTLKLIGMIGSREFDFLYWYREDIFKKLNEVFALREGNLQASVKMAYTEMLMALINHNSGRQWIIETGTWKDVIRFCHSNHTLYVTRESQKFIWKLLQYESGNAEFCKEVIFAATEPLINNTFSPQVHPSFEDNYLDQNELLLTIIDLITAIMENTLFVSMDNTIPHLLASVTNLESRVKGLFEASISTKFFGHIMKLMYLILFMNLKTGIKPPSEIVDPDIMMNFYMNMRYIDSMLLAKKYILDMVKAAKILLIYWKKINSLCKITLPDENKIEYHCTIIMLIPLCACIGPNENRDDMEMLMQKVFKVTCSYTQRLGYMMRDVIIKGDIDFEPLCKTSIQLNLDIIDITDRDCAVITFQLMYHILEYCTPSNIEKLQTEKLARSPEKEHPRIPKLQRILDGDPVVERQILLAALFDGLAIIIKKFKINWQECLETINVLSMSQNILGHSSITPKLCVQALTLCKLAIQNFMAPNLALLVHWDGGTDDLGPVLFKRIHDPNWEVRDSVLEVINTIAEIAEHKYPAFQDLLLENKFPQLIVDVAKSDGESYVRATAFTCITILVRIDRIWNEILCHLDLPKMAIELMNNESEAIVRREAVILVRELYVHRKWPKSTIDKMAKAMAVAAVLDLHWEVKVNALQFWGQFIKSHFSDQGMLDGTFPTVTFSKEHKKIVSLNHDEIKKRILKALDELAAHNCLGILLAALNDESDFQVCKAAAEILKKFKVMVLKYKLDETLMRESLDKMLLGNKDFNEMLQPNDQNGACFLSNNNERITTDMDQSQMPADIIESIVSADDMNLLASVYNQTMNVSTNDELVDDEKLKLICSVDRNEFLHSVLRCDIDAYIEERSYWLKTYTNSFSSVVDDILVAHEKKNVNEMDCY